MQNLRYYPKLILEPENGAINHPILVVNQPAATKAFFEPGTNHDRPLLLADTKRPQDFNHARGV